MTTAQIETLFGDLKAGLVPLVKEIAARPGVDDSSSSTIRYAKKWDFTLLLLRGIG